MEAAIEGSRRVGLPLIVLHGQLLLNQLYYNRLFFDMLNHSLLNVLTETLAIDSQHFFSAVQFSDHCLIL